MGNIVRIEKILSDTFLNIETVEGQNPIWFHYGDSKELDSILLQKKNVSKYPLLWYSMPNKLDVFESVAKGDFSFVLAHITELEWNNDQRFNKVYEDILFPYMENMLKALSKSKNCSFSTGDEFSFTNFPNYGTSSNKSETLDGCDAIKIDVYLELFEDNKC